MPNWIRARQDRITGIRFALTRVTEEDHTRMAMSYAEVLRRLGRRTSVQLDKRRGTELRKAPGEAGDHGDLELRHHGVSLVTFHPDGTYTLRTGGTASKTNIARIGEYAPVSVVRRGHGYYIEDIAGRCAECGKAGRLIPFLDGIRVDTMGTIITTPPQYLPAQDVMTASDPGADAQSGNLHEYIRAIVAETLSTHVTPRRGVRMQAKAREAPAFSIAEVEQMMLANLPKEKAERALRNLKSALSRGRAETTTVVSGSGPSECPRCRTPLVAHYDGANRYRGCDYALQHYDPRTEVPGS